MINYIDNDELPIGFTMELALHSDILNKFAHMDKARQEQIVNGARTVNSRDEMRNYVESIAKDVYKRQAQLVEGPYAEG